jgi:hypothetical protein
MSLKTLLNLKTNGPDYGTHHLRGTVSVEKTFKAIAVHHNGSAVYPRTGNDADKGR